MARGHDVAPLDDADDAGLERLFAQVRHLARESGPVALDRSYLRAVESVDSRSENQSGADKTWVFSALRQFREYFGRAVQVR